MAAAASLLIEICVDSVASALAAKSGGADRIELCQDLIEGGITPSLGLLQTVREKIELPIQVLIRPRGGDFLYSEEELSVMEKDIQLARDHGADGIVVGALLPDGSVDEASMSRLLEAAAPLPVTEVPAGVPAWIDLAARPGTATISVGWATEASGLHVSSFDGSGFDPGAHAAPYVSRGRGLPNVGSVISGDDSSTIARRR